MELVRIVRKSMLCIICLFIAMICISIYQINYNQDNKVYYEKVKEGLSGENYTLIKDFLT